MLQKPNSHLLRRGRYSESGRAYLVTSVVYQRRPVFTSLRLGRLLVAELKQAHDLNLVDSLAWVIMPDHFHWLFELRRAALPEVMRRVKSRSTLTINRACHTQGAFWQSGYHDRAVRAEEDLIRMARYVIANPLRAGLVKHIGDYSLWDAAWL
ncbi:transposase [Pseudomonas sp. ICBG1301]|uniref:REP-associated tyrosine transposase n=1 Tax=unclassified Pseudomonas TaxID=196821 RepID=UPI000F865E00|nr:MULTISPECIES: transposase [unclassified Pseudomonas]MBM9489017.1 transposase [Pseudomonas sp. ICBG1301]NCE87954.1 transposase [Pseudomonas sp. Q1]RUQ47015.1 transposase [Corynebacterium pseudodiphtheriticum]